MEMMSGVRLRMEKMGNFFILNVDAEKCTRDRVSLPVSRSDAISVAVLRSPVASGGAKTRKNF